MQIFNVTWKWNVPNALSLVRMALIPVFMGLYFSHQDLWAFAVLLLSGLTDAVDGWIARRFNQITDCGKLLDPLSDKLTQVAVVISLATRYAELWPLAALCFVKETCQAIGGIVMLKRKCEVRGSLWFGKVSTTVLFCGLGLMEKAPDATTISVNRTRRFRDNDIAEKIFQEILRQAMEKKLVGVRSFTRIQPM